MRSSIVLFLVLALIVSSLSVVVCGGKKEEAKTGQVGEEASKPKQEAGKVDRGWSDVPLYQGASASKEEGQMAVPAVAQGEYERTERRWYETADTPEQVYEYYLKEMPEKGWAKLFAMKYPEGSTVSVWRKGDGDRGCAISSGVRSDGMTHIGMLLNEGKK